MKRTSPPTFLLSLIGGFSLPLLVTTAYAGTLGQPPLPAWLATINLVLIVLMGKDKFAAGRSLPRTPEFTLLALTFAGATPALLIGRKLFKHKTSKEGFVAAMWGTIAAQLACIYYFRDALLTWI